MEPIELSRVIDQIALSHLEQADHNSPAPSDTFDEASMMKQNAMDFQLFELKFLEATGVHGRLHVNAQQADRQDDPSLIGILEGATNGITQVASRIQTTVASEQEATDGSVAVATRYASSILKTGVADQTIQASLFSWNLSDLLTEVTRKTGLNKLIEGWTYRMFPSTCAESTADSEGLHAERAGALYNHLLRAQQCKMTNHSACLQLSGWGDSSKNSVFNMFLSRCEGNGWHKATCTFKSGEYTNSNRHEVNICVQVNKDQAPRVPLLLDFNNKQLWKADSHQSLKHIELLPKGIDQCNLGDLLSQDELKTTDIDTVVRKFRLALRLASSLQSLVFGPWVQEDWSSHSVYIFYLKNITPVQMLDEAYISCKFNADWEATKNEPGPRFFLSLAQVLADVANGQRGSVPKDCGEWYDALESEMLAKRQEQPMMTDYWNAVEGCIVYKYYYENLNPQMNDEDENRRQRQDFIDERIIRPLQKHLDFWKKQREARRIENAAQNSEGAQLVGSDSSTRRASVDTNFLLWSDKDDDWEKIPPPTTESSEFSFITRMKTFRDRYIETLPEPEETTDGDGSVRVAIVDTGFSINGYDEENKLIWDPLLTNPSVEPRVTKRRNFFHAGAAEPDPNDYEDRHGHGTQVARLVLRFAPRATVIIAKISDSNTLNETKMTQLVKALEWAGENADIINLSFGLNSTPQPEVATVIKSLIDKNKLIFAAASNTGGYGARSWPAKEIGVFAIHANDEFGKVNKHMNPPIQTPGDNFSTFGWKVDSFWGGHHRSISGTSFATPVAAAIAANILEYARRKHSNVAENLARYGAMSALFRNYISSYRDGYCVLHPWAEKLWGGETDDEHIENNLRTATVSG
ncbi:hypothetical protein HDV63DRAFT_390715 [Trichoderma sp. SZMC 28014]